MISLLNANALHIPLADQSVQMCVTSPPYWGLRSYDTGDNKAYELGSEETPEQFVENMVAVFREVKRVLRDDGTLWLNLGDSYASDTKGTGGPTEKQKSNAGSFYEPKKLNHGLKQKDLCGIPWRVALALQADGWYLRSDIIWAKPNPMPESVTDRPTKSHEYIFLLSKSQRYFYDADAVREEAAPSTMERDKYDRNQPRSANLHHGEGYMVQPANTETKGGRNRRTVWTIEDDEYQQFLQWKAEHARDKKDVLTIATAPYSGAHFATYPPALVEPCIKAGTSEAGCCPTCGAPWERTMEITGGLIGKGWTDHKADLTKGMTQVPRADGGTEPYKRITTGWQPTCSHSADPVPCTVLDPFAGSGTTLLVARQLGRSAVGLDLSFAYLHDQARSRLSLDALEAWEYGIQDKSDLSALPLFGGEA